MVCVDTRDSVVSLACVFAAALLGAAYVPFEPSLAERRQPRVTCFLRTLDCPPCPSVSQTLIDETWSAREALPPDDTTWMTGFSGPDDLCWIMPSSGTTGRPKYSNISVGLLDARLRAVAEDYAPGPTRLVLLFDCWTRPYLIRAVAVILAGQVLVDMRRREYLARSGFNFVCASPRQIRMWLGEERLDPKVPVLQVSGARLPAESVEILLESFDRIEDVYGSNETIKAHVNVIRRRDGRIEALAKTGQRFVEVVNEMNAAVPDGSAGILRIRTPYMVDSYIDDPVATARHFRDGWFYPGDFGVFLDGDCLRVLGRGSDVVNIEGDKILLSDVEDALCGLPEIASASVFENDILDSPDRLLACVTLARPDSGFEAVERSWLACAKTLGPFAAPGMILVVPHLPATPDGVPMRSHARAHFAGTLRKGDPIILNSHLFRFRVDMNG